MSTRAPRARPVKWRNPCETCGAQDNRDAEHAHGCPALEPLTRDELVALARAVEDGWRRDFGARKVRSAAAA